MLSSVLFVLSLACLANCLHYQPRTALSQEEAFEEYNVFWNKTHASLAEKQQRFNNFVTAGKKIAEANSKRVGEWSATFGYTQFADWSAEEFKRLNGFIPSRPLVDPTLLSTKRTAAPSGSIDWAAKGMITAVKNQEQCGSCWAFSATETVESANLIAGNQVPNGSPQEIVDCDTSDDGCNGGDPQEALQWVVNQGGLDTERCYPYTAQDGQCASSSCSPNANLKISTVTPVSGDERSIHTALQSMPLSICCDAQPWQYYTGGIMSASQCGTSIDHAIQLTGYKADSNIPQGGYWIVRNSWGASWGENGFIRLTYGENTCGITSEVTAASV